MSDLRRKFECQMQLNFEREMKRSLALLVLLAILFSACGPRPMYKTREGKRKTRYYNAVQFGNPNVPDYPKKKKKK